MASPFYLQTLLRLAAEHPHLHNAMAHHSQTPGSTASDSSPRCHQQTQKTSFAPAFDLLETAHEYILEGELPGLHDKKRTVIEFTDAQTMSIHGKIERDEEAEGEKADVGGPNKIWVAERKVGEFQRSFTFPESVDVDTVKATLEYGVLRIVVPKVAKAGARRIQVQ